MAREDEQKFSAKIDQRQKDLRKLRQRDPQQANAGFRADATPSIAKDRSIDPLQQGLSRNEMLRRSFIRSNPNAVAPRARKEALGSIASETQEFRTQERAGEELAIQGQAQGAAAGIAGAEVQGRTDVAEQGRLGQEAQAKSQENIATTQAGASERAAKIEVQGQFLLNEFEAGRLDAEALKSFIRDATKFQTVLRKAAVGTDSKGGRALAAEGIDLLEGEKVAAKEELGPGDAPRPTSQDIAAAASGDLDGVKGQSPNERRLTELIEISSSGLSDPNNPDSLPLNETQRTRIDTEMANLNRSIKILGQSKDLLAR